MIVQPSHEECLPELAFTSNQVVKIDMRNVTTTPTTPTKIKPKVPPQPCGVKLTEIDCCLDEITLLSKRASKTRGNANRLPTKQWPEHPLPAPERTRQGRTIEIENEQTKQVIKNRVTQTIPRIRAYPISHVAQTITCQP